VYANKRIAQFSLTLCQTSEGYSDQL